MKLFAISTVKLIFMVIECDGVERKRCLAKEQEDGDTEKDVSIPRNPIIPMSLARDDSHGRR